MMKIIATVGALGSVALSAFAGYSLAVKPSAAAPVEMDGAAGRQPSWMAGGIGRVEPKFGETRVSSALAGRIVEIPVRVNDRAEEGEVLLRLDDEEARFRLMAAETEASARKRERDSQAVTAGREEAKRAEDSVYSSERMAAGARFELDSLIALRRKGGLSEKQLADARQRLRSVQDQLTRDRASLGAALSKTGLAAPNRLETAFTAARAEVAIAETMLDKTRLRATSAGTVLQINPRVGEMIAPAPDQPLIVVGDTSSMRVRAEIDEVDSSKIKVGQRAVVRSDAYPGREFDAKVSAIAPTLAAPRLGGRGPRRPTDVDVLEVMVDLEGTVPLLPGMRADVYFR